MAENTQLNAFLSEQQEAPPAPEPTPAPEPAPTPREAPASTPAPTTPESEEEPAEASERLEAGGKQFIPQSAYEHERKRRQDWKEKALRGEERLTALQRELDAAKAASQPAAPQQPAAPEPVLEPFQFRSINPALDPEGWAQQMQAFQQHQQRQLEIQQYQQWRRETNERLNLSERLTREKHGAEAVDAAVTEFRQLAGGQDHVWRQLYSHPDPYGWMLGEVSKQRLLREIGDDPAAYQAKLVAAERAKWEAERTAAPPPSPAAGMPRSLANVRSVAGRMAPQWTGEPSLEEVLAPVQNRKRANGAALRSY